MGCRHLAPLEQALRDAGIPVSFRCQAWTDNCRTRVPFDCWLDEAAFRARMKFDQCVVVHDNEDPRSGLEAGFVCLQWYDGVVGGHEFGRAGARVFA